MAADFAKPPELLQRSERILAMPVTPQYLLQGTWYALEQCGLLLRDANELYRSNSYANALVLTAFARENLDAPAYCRTCGDERSPARISR